MSDSLCLKTYVVVPQPQKGVEAEQTKGRLYKPPLNLCEVMGGLILLLGPVGRVSVAITIAVAISVTIAIPLAE